MIFTGCDKWSRTTNARMFDSQAGLELLGGALDSLSYPNKVLLKNEDQSEGVDVLALHNLLMKGCYQKHDLSIRPIVAEDDPQAFRIFVKNLCGGMVSVLVQPTTTTEDLMEEISIRENIPVENQRLIFAGRQLEKKKTLLDYCIGRETTLHFLLRLRGGGRVEIKLPLNLLDSRYHFDFTGIVDQTTFYRGGMTYIRPCGWYRFALKVDGRYSDDVWLEGKKQRPNQFSSNEGEWPVSYHGTSYHNGLSIAAEGFQLSKGRRFKFGFGIYSTSFKLWTRFFSQLLYTLCQYK